MHIPKNVKVLGREDRWTGGEWPVFPKEPRSGLGLGWSWMVGTIPGVWRGCSGMENPAQSAGRGSALDPSGNLVIWSWVGERRGFRI